jgi:cation transport ATPase
VNLSPHAKTVSPLPQVWSSEGAIHLRDERTLALAAGSACERFLLRVLNVDGVRSVAVDRSQSTAVIQHGVGAREAATFLKRLSSTIRDGIPPERSLSLPHGTRATTFTVYRHGSVLSTCQILHDRQGRLRLRHARLRRDPKLDRAVEVRLASLPGVTSASVSRWADYLEIRYNPAMIPTTRLIRVVEETIDDSGGWGAALPEPTKTRFGLENFNLGLSGAADFAVPILMPVSAFMLIGTNLGTFRSALLQIRKRKFGLPVLYTVIVGATLASGQFFASALMSWLFKFWHDRLRQELASERRRFLDLYLPRPGLGRILTPDGVEVMVPTDRLRVGDRVVVLAEEAVPIDGIVLAGEGIVDERSVRGLEGASRKRLGDTLLAGSTVLAGSFQLEVAQPAERTRASAIGRAMVSLTSPAPGSLSPALFAERFANRTVGPTLATAGLGLLVGDLTAAGAILRPDYATGPGLAVPLETLRDAADCARLGIVARASDAFERLAEVDLIVIRDSPGLSDHGLEIRSIQTQLPETELLRYAASAYRHMSDPRSMALLDACRARSIHLLNLAPMAFDPGVTIVHGKWRIRVRDQTTVRQAGAPLLVEVDDAAVGLIEFGRSAGPSAVSSLRRVREISSVPIVLLSHRSPSESFDLATALGVDAHLGNLSVNDTWRFLRSCRDRGLRTAFVADCREHQATVGEAHVAISLGAEGEVESDVADLMLLQPRLERLADLWDIAQAHNDRIRSTHRFIMVPNLVCVAGAFFLGATALTSVLVSNLGTMSVYSKAVGSLRSLPQGRVRRLSHTNKAR